MFLCFILYIVLIIFKSLEQSNIHPSRKTRTVLRVTGGGSGRHDNALKPITQSDEGRRKYRLLGVGKSRSLWSVVSAGDQQQCVWRPRSIKLLLSIDRDRDERVLLQKSCTYKRLIHIRAWELDAWPVFMSLARLLTGWSLNGKSIWVCLMWVCEPLSVWDTMFLMFLFSERLTRYRVTAARTLQPEQWFRVTDPETPARLTEETLRFVGSFFFFTVLLIRLSSSQSTFGGRFLVVVNVNDT